MYFVIKNHKKWGIFPHDCGADMTHRARKANVARGTRADATRHAGPHGRAARAHVRHRWRTGRRHVAWATRVHADARERHHVARGLASEGLTG